MPPTVITAAVAVLCAAHAPSHSHAFGHHKSRALPTVRTDHTRICRGHHNNIINNSIKYPPSCYQHRRRRQRTNHPPSLFMVQSSDEDIITTRYKRNFDEDSDSDSKNSDLIELSPTKLKKMSLDQEQQEQEPYDGDTGDSKYELLEKQIEQISITTDIEQSNIIDNFWSWALQSSSSPSDTTRAKQINRRMQMFAYLSQPTVEVQIIGLVLLSCFLVAIDTLQDLPVAVRKGINIVDTLCVYVFAVEFFLRWWSAGRFQLRYLAKPLVSIDAIVVILPLVLSGLLPIWDFGVMTGVFPGVSLPGWLISSSSANSALLNLRLLRILKFQRVLSDENTYMKFEMALGMKKNDIRPYQLQLARVIMSLFTLISVSTGLIYTAEHDVNPQIPDYFTALYFGLTTLTTVGFGDITPVTFEGRLVVGGSILAGVAVIPAQAASLAEAYLDFQKEKSFTGKQRKRVVTVDQNAMSETQTCGQCGAEFHRLDASFCWSCGEQLD